MQIAKEGYRLSLHRSITYKEEFFLGTVAKREEFHALLK
jgi:hypothetical protein